jgi:hypothetical protein
MNCQNRVAARALPLPLLPRHCQRGTARINRVLKGRCHAATALPLLSAKRTLFRESLVAVTTFGGVSERASACRASGCAASGDDSMNSGGAG